MNVPVEDMHTSDDDVPESVTADAVTMNPAKLKSNLHIFKITTGVGNVFGMLCDSLKDRSSEQSDFCPRAKDLQVSWARAP